MPLVVLAGPPLPGRWSLARALHERIANCRFTVDEPGSVPRLEVERALTDGTCVLVDGDLATRVEREQILALGGPARDRLLVEWRCCKQQAEREIFHRYAKRPKVLARDEFRRYLRDARVRQPIDELPREQVIHVEAGAPIDEQVAAIAERLQRPLSPPRERTGARRVMIVEDDSDERTMLAEVLCELGFAVEIAPDAGVAMALLDEGVDVDLLISDQRMPGMTGIELSDELTRRHPDVRTVLVTAYGDADTCRAAVQAHAVTVLAKPLSVMDLERVLEEAIV